MEDALNLELHIAAEIFMTEDAREGPKAFKEKRKPVWKSK
jgi:enoyl-CoA hydratase